MARFEILEAVVLTIDHDSIDCPLVRHGWLQAERDSSVGTMGRALLAAMPQLAKVRDASVVRCDDVAPAGFTAYRFTAPKHVTLYLLEWPAE